MLKIHFLFLFLVLGLTPVSRAQDESRETRLQQLLKRVPAADTNRDGTLTLEEARAFQQTRSSQQTERGERAASVEPTHRDVKYGNHERNVLDLYLVHSVAPTPLIIFIHGGGFVGGDKSGVNAQLIRLAHEAGISFASINYRYATTKPFPAQQHDAARAIQFLRANAKEYNLDGTRFAAFGGSAGAGLSMWLGYHDDLANPASDDPVERQSTRLSAIGSIGGQSTYDPNLIKEWVGGKAYAHRSLTIVYGIDSIEQMTDSKLQPVYDEVSAIKHLTPDDPPIYMIYSEPDRPLPDDARPGQGIHHPIFGHKLAAELDKLKIEYVYVHTDDVKTSRTNVFEGLGEFLIRHLSNQKKSD